MSAENANVTLATLATEEVFEDSCCSEGVGGANKETVPRSARSESAAQVCRKHSDDQTTSRF